MNKLAAFVLILLCVGLFLWMQRDEFVDLGSGSFGGAAGGTPAQQSENFIIREKIKPGGYIGWHTTEMDKLTNSPTQTRQASFYYFVCTGRSSGARKVFLVPEGTFNMERIGNILTAQQASTFQEVTTFEEPPLPPSFQFRRREPQ